MNGIGASEAGIICGQSHFSNSAELWKEKTGRVAPADLAGNENVEYGTEAEALLRGLFALKHKREYAMEYHQFRIYVSEETPYITATLDGELVRLSDNERGVWECKTAKISSKKALEQWEGNRIPMHYYCQVCHQLYVTGWNFAVLNAELRFPDNHAEIREYTISREEAKDDIEFVVSQEKNFWRYVERDKEPPIKFSL